MQKFATNLGNRRITVSDSAVPWLKRFHFGYSKELVETLKQFPGCRWDPADKCWLVPVEVIELLKPTPLPTGLKPAPATIVAPPPLHAYQARDAAIAAGQPAFLWAYEMGVGKTASVIQTLKHRDAKQFVVACPAMARGVWRKELDKWWPDHPDIDIVTSGKEAEQAQAPIRVVSYGLLSKLSRRASEDALIFDELHYVANPNTRRSRIAREMTLDYPQAFRGGMTGTLFTQDPVSAHHPLDILWPGRVGTKFKWNKRYTNSHHNGYGWEFKGVDPDFADELAHRMRWMTSRVTKRDVAHLLPAFIPELIWLERKTSPSKAAIEMAQDAVAGGCPHVALLTHKRSTAHALAKKLKLPGAVTGELAPAKRDELIEQLKSGSFTVATIDSTKVAIDLTHATTVIYVELVYDLGSLLQSLGRFHRLSSQSNVSVFFLVEPENDEVATNIRQKVVGLNSILKAGIGEEGLAASLAGLDGGGLSTDEWDELLSAAAASFTGLDSTGEF